MSRQPEAPNTKHFCNHMAIDRGLEPVGNAGDFDDAVIVEMPLPWKYNITQQEGLLPDEMLSLLEIWLQQYRDGHGYRHRPLIVAPDPEYSEAGYRRVMFYRRPQGLFSHFTKVEYLVPEHKLGQLVWSLYETRHLLAQFEQYKVEGGENIRDLLVCTHGAVDAACGKFGYPLYKNLRDNYTHDTLRAWRVSHFGGHVFAPTLMDMPIGHYWAYVQDEQIAPIINHSGDVTVMRGHYRGWSGTGYGFMQVAECALWQQYGWQWFDAIKSAEIIAQDDAEQPTWADVRIDYQLDGDTEPSQATMRVDITHIIETNPSTGKDNAYPYPQYQVTPIASTLSAVANSGS